LTGDPMAPELFLTQEEEGEMVRRLEQAGISKSDLVVGVNPGSTYGGAKRWLPERFAESTDRVSRRLSESEGKAVSVVILGAKGEEQLGREIAARLSTRSAVLSGMTTIRELMAALKRCSLLLTNDTGPMHIAAAFQVPVVAVFGPTDWRTTSPYGENHALVRQPVDCAPCLQRECPIDHRCMTRISVDQVVEAMVKLIDPMQEMSSGRQTVGAPALVPSPLPSTPLNGVTVFLDRDGTLNYDPGFVTSVAELKLLPGVSSALARLKTAGAKLVVVTNQSGIGRGMFTLKELEAIHARLQGLLEQEGAVLDAIYFCPHHPDDGCRCRKPGRAMVDRAVADLHLDLQRSYLVGDHMRDMQLAKAVGARAILLTTEAVGAKALEVLQVEQAMPDKVAKSLVEAADWILEDAAKTMHSSVAVGEKAGRGHDGGDA